MVLEAAPQVKVISFEQVPRSNWARKRKCTGVKLWGMCVTTERTSFRPASAAAGFSPEYACLCDAEAGWVVALLNINIGLCFCWNSGGGWSWRGTRTRPWTQPSGTAQAGVPLQLHICPWTSVKAPQWQSRAVICYASALLLFKKPKKQAFLSSSVRHVTYGAFLLLNTINNYYIRPAFLIACLYWKGGDDGSCPLTATMYPFCAWQLQDVATW